MIIKQSHVISQVTGDDEPILVYAENKKSPHVSDLQKHAENSEFEIEIVALTLSTKDVVAFGKNTQLPLLIACDNLENAILLTEKYGLLDWQVYWLSADTAGLEDTQINPGHQFVDWRACGVLAVILNLLKQQTHITRDKLYIEHKLALLSGCLGDLSLTLNAQGNIIGLNIELMSLMRNQGLAAIGQNWLDSLHIPSSTAKSRLQHILSDLSHTHSMTRLPPFPIQLNNTVVMVDGFVGSLPNDEILIVLRQVASWQSHEWLGQLKEQDTPITLILINPDNFSEFNRAYGRDEGDQVLGEIICKMSDTLRDDDFVSRFSGAVFAAHLPETNEQQGQDLATRMLQMLRNTSFSSKKIKLEFSFGMATLDAEERLGEQSPLELFRRANAALQAARSVGGGKLVIWKPQFDTNILANLDRMSGKFSEVPSDDFRLMNLQWDIIRLIGSTHSLQMFSSQVCQLLSTGLQSEFAGLYMRHGDDFTSLSCSTASDDVDTQSIHKWLRSNIKLDSIDSKVIKPVARLTSFHGLVIPLVTRDQCLAVLVICWPLEKKHEAQKCTQQLERISPNLAAAIDRIILLEQEKNKPILPNKDNFDASELLFKSSAMHNLMQQVQLVAPTDASVLIIGESGTGKELIAQQIHKRGLCPDKPFITVDCSTIVEHLIESELFGHKKGAFTGATSSQPGQIAQADGGTLFLDEVGELPLDIQSKLLRFVQEKTFVAVGDQRVRKVDVRLVFATNRNLSDEVTEGRFRADLYHRINVFTLSLPALKHRSEDSLLLSRHFLRQFIQQYKKDIKDFSDNALEKLHNYTWPGNVRELRNCIMRAVILCPGHYVEPEHLILQQEMKANNRLPQINDTFQAMGESLGAISNSKEDDLSQISAFLSDLVNLTCQQTEIFSVSNWLEKQWLSRCVVKWGSLYQVAHNINQSESTIRRRYTKLNAQIFERTELDEITISCNRLLDNVLQSHPHSKLWQKIESLLYIIVLQQDVSQQKKALLLNVTQPTLRKIIQQTDMTRPAY